jgi:hypothetical protein
MQFIRFGSTRSEVKDTEGARAPEGDTIRTPARVRDPSIRLQRS